MPRTKGLNPAQGYSEYTPPSTSSTVLPSSTSNTSPSRKTRSPASVRVLEATQKKKSLQSSRSPHSVSQQEKNLRDKETLADSSADDAPTKSAHASSLLSDSSDSDSIESASTNSSDSSELSESFEIHTEPKLAVRNQQSIVVKQASTAQRGNGVGERIPSFINMLVQNIWQAIDQKNWDRLGRLIDGMREANLRFDPPSLQNTWSVLNIVGLAPLALLTANEQGGGANQEKRWLLALDLLDLGCNWDAKDQHGNRAIDLLRKQASPELIEFVLQERPELRHLLLKA